MESKMFIILCKSCITTFSNFITFYFGDHNYVLPNKYQRTKTKIEVRSQNFNL